MYRLSAILLGIALGGGAMYVALQYHLVRANQGYFLVPKRIAGLSEVYVDVRRWSPVDWQNHPEFLQDLIRDGREELVPAPTNRSFFGDWLRGFGGTR